MLRFSPVLFFLLLFTGVLPSQSVSSVPSIPFDRLGTEVRKRCPASDCCIQSAGDEALIKAPLQALEARATPFGLWIGSAAATTEPGHSEPFRLRAVSLIRGGSVTRLLDKGVIRSGDLAATFDRPHLIEEYRAGTEGIRQDFVIPSRPAGGGEDLTVELDLTGAVAEAAGYGAKLTLDDGGRELAYSRLLVTDATGAELTARMEVTTAHRIHLNVVDAAATYPIRIDPTFSDADWVAFGQFPGVTGGGTINALTMDPTGNLYLGGYFTNAGGVAANYVVKWDGSNWSALGPGVNGQVYALAADGINVYAAGLFSTAGAPRRTTSHDGMAHSGPHSAPAQMTR